MSLFKWSTPERQRADRILPIVPNEIYLYIFEHIAPSSGRLTSEQLRIFANLSCICRFFANFCLPRIFEFVEFSGNFFQYSNDAVYKTFPETSLCTEIAAKQPLALALAKTVKTCHFSRWKLDDRTGSWEVPFFANKYLAGISYMTNIRELGFFQSFVDVEHWDAIAALGSLEELTFHSCRFLQGPANLEPEKRVRVKLSCLRVVRCVESRQLVAAIDVRYLRTLATDIVFFRLVDGLPQSLEALALCEIDGSLGFGESVVRSILDDLASVQKNFPLLRSLTLVALNLDRRTEILSSVLENISLHTCLQSFTLNGHWAALEISFTEARRVIQDKLGPASSIKDVNIYGRVLHLVDEEWLEHDPTECSLSDKLLSF